MSMTTSVAESGLASTSPTVYRSVTASITRGESVATPLRVMADSDRERVVGQKYGEG